MAPPQLHLSTAPLPDVAGAEALAVLTGAQDGAAVLRSGATQVAAAYGLDLVVYLGREEAKGEAGEVVSMPVLVAGSPVRAVHLVGTGDGSPAALRRAGAALARRLKGRSLAVAAAHDLTADGLRAFAEGLGLAAYAFSRRSAPKKPAPVEAVTLAVTEPAAMADALHRAEVTARATHLARDLANTPSNEKSPAWLARQAVEVARQQGLEVDVREPDWLAAEGFGGLLAVGMGSVRPPRLVELRYLPVGGGGPHVVLVGKGITYDSGGLSLKPREAMVPMKTDMGGAAAVLAALGGCRDLGVSARVTALLPLAENLPSGSAQRPGDVIRQYGGRTVEVLNTDAEGRLVLADALAYAVQRLDPDVLVDLATLTGAATLGLGRRHAALFATDDALAADLAAAGEASGERVWRLPLVEEYREVLDSPVADLANVARDTTGGGGAITAALFLREFTGGRRWAHLDIAGPARSDTDEHEVTKGGTGYGARVLLRWLEGLPGEAAGEAAGESVG